MIDAHIHIDFYDNPTKIVREIIKQDISAVFVTHLPELFEKYENLYSNIPQLFLAVGFHPILVNEYEFNEKLFLNSLTKTRFVGEIGLDYSVARSDISRHKQKIIFEKICKYSNKHILSIHSRHAEKEVFKTLSDCNVENAIFHWYSGEKELIPYIIDAGYYFSVNPSMLRSNKGRSILKEIPQNKILIETDGPFSKFNGNIAEPLYLKEIYNAFESFYGIKNLEDIVFNNLMSIIG